MILRSGEIDRYIESVNASLAACGIKCAELAMLDHVGYGVETKERYEVLKLDWSRQIAHIDESMVNGRPISVFEYSEPVNSGGWSIPYVELPSPKPFSAYDEGLDHAEFVTIGGVDAFAGRHPELLFERTGSLVNRTLKLKLATLTLKFHELPLGAVVRIEQRFAAKEEN